LVQLIAVIAVLLYSGIVTVVLFKVSDKILGVRVPDKLEAIGLDETQHGETAYTSFD
jgi:Amt family ammonium transporter